MNLKNVTKKHGEKIKTEIYAVIAGQALTLQDLMDMNCPNFVAAKRLEKKLNRLKIFTIHALNRLDPFSLFNMKGVGIMQIFVAMCVLHAHPKYDGVKWLDNFTPKKREKQDV